VFDGLAVAGVEARGAVGPQPGEAGAGVQEPVDEQGEAGVVGVGHRGDPQVGHQMREWDQQYHRRGRRAVSLYEAGAFTWPRFRATPIARIAS
jgi:hypothetical protein